MRAPKVSTVVRCQVDPDDEKVQAANKEYAKLSSSIEVGGLLVGGHSSVLITLPFDNECVHLLVSTI